MLAKKKLQRHRSTRQEIADLLNAARRALHDARIEEMSPDGRFISAYHGMLSLATAVLAASGFRATGLGKHATTIQVLPLLMKNTSQLAAYLEVCRRKRNEAVYERAGVVTVSEAEELAEALEQFIGEVRNWLNAHYPDLSPE